MRITTQKINVYKILYVLNNYATYKIIFLADKIGSLIIYVYSSESKMKRIKILFRYFVMTPI